MTVGIFASLSCVILYGDIIVELFSALLMALSLRWCGVERGGLTCTVMETCSGSKPVPKDVAVEGDIRAVMSWNRGLRCSR